MNGNAVVKIIKNTLTPSAWDDMMLNKSKSSFVNSDGTKSDDGPTIMKVLLEDIDPSSSINTKLHRHAIKQAKVQDFKGNICVMLKSTEHHYQVIVEDENSHDIETHRRHLLTQLFSGSNVEFDTNIQAIKSDLEVGYGYHSDITPQVLITSSRQLYESIDRRKA